MFAKLAFSTALFLAAGAAQAQTMPIPARAVLYSADGTKLGRIENVVNNADGTPQAVKLIYRGKFITIPAGTLSAGEKGLKTSIDNATLKRM